MKKYSLFRNSFRKLNENNGACTNSFQFNNVNRCLSTTANKQTQDLTRASSILTSHAPDISLPNLDHCSAHFPIFEKYSNKDALECSSTGQKITFGDLLDYSLKWCGKLEEIRKTLKESEVNPRVSIMAPNVMEYAPVIFGTFAAGWTINTVNTNFKCGEIQRQLRDIEPSVIVVDTFFEQLMEEAIKEAEIDVRIVTIGTSSRGNPDLKEIIYNSSSPLGKVREVSSSDTSTILYSGGTTGLPKGVCISHAALTNNLLCITHKDFYPLGHTPDGMHTSVIGLMPFYHSYGYFAVLLTNLFQGSKVIVCRTFDPLKFGSIIKQHKIKSLNLVPTLLNFVINSKAVKTEDLSTVTNVLIAAAPVLPYAAKAFIQKCDKEIQFQEGFGMTETLANLMSPLNSAKIGYCGKLVPNTKAKIVDPETKKTLGVEEKGELYLKCPGMMTKYLNNPQQTSEAIDEEGWLHTGDMATVSEDGYFKIVDRLKDMIKVKGYQVSPAEVENTIMEHEAVSDVAVVGVLDERLGEKVRAFVTLKKKVTEDEIIKHVADRLATYKGLSGGVVFLDSLPKLETGKISRKDLRMLNK